MADQPLKPYSDLKVWNLGLEIAVDCYRQTHKFPASERDGHTRKIQPGSSRIPAKIAEGYGRNHRGEYLQFLWITNGSLYELETHRILSVMVGIADKNEVDPFFISVPKKAKYSSACFDLSKIEIRHPEP